MSLIVTSEDIFANSFDRFDLQTAGVSLYEFLDLFLCYNAIICHAIKT